MFARACRFASIAEVSAVGTAVLLCGGFTEMKSCGGVPTGVVECMAT